MAAGLISEEFARELAEQLREAKNERRRLAEMLAAVRREPSESPELLIENTSTTRIPRYSVIQPEGVNISTLSPTTIWDGAALWHGSVYNRYTGSTFPGDDDGNYDCWGVTLDDIEPGGIGRFVMDGLVWVRCWEYPTYSSYISGGSVNNPWHRGVVPNSGETQARFCEQGPARVFSVISDGATGYLALVQLNAGYQWYGFAVGGTQDNVLTTDTTKCYGIEELSAIYGDEGLTRNHRCLLDRYSRGHGANCGSYTLENNAIGTKCYRETVAVDAEAWFHIKHYSGTSATTSSDRNYGVEAFFALFDSSNNFSANVGTSAQAKWKQHVRGISSVNDPPGITILWDDLHRTQAIHIRYVGNLTYQQRLVPLVRNLYNDGAEFQMTAASFRVTEHHNHPNYAVGGSL